MQLCKKYVTMQGVYEPYFFITLSLHRSHYLSPFEGKCTPVQGIANNSLLGRGQNQLKTTELLFQKMPNFITNQKFLKNFVLIFAKDNTDCFLFCNLDGTLLKREDLLKFVFFFEVG